MKYELSLDLIKSFLIGINFEIDESSFDKANKSINNAGKKIKEFNDSNNEGFSETSNSLKDLFSLLGSSQTIGSLLPGLRKPFKNILSDIKNIKEYYNNLSNDEGKSKEFIKEKEIVKDKVNETVESVVKKTVKVKESIKDVVNEKNINKTTESFKETKKDISDVKETVKNVVNKNISNEATETFTDSIRKTIKDIYNIKEVVKNKITETVNTMTNKNTENEKTENIINRIKEKNIKKEFIKNRKITNKKEVPNLKEDKKYKKTTSLKNIKKLNETKGSVETIGIAAKNTTSMVGGLEKGIGSLAAGGGTALKAISVSSVATFAVVAGVILGAIALIAALLVSLKKLTSYLNKLAKNDIEYEKLSRTLWTSKEVAKEVSQALDILGASMEDLWLSPTLLKQFNQLRQDASQLRIPPEFQENLKLVQDIGLEFNRLKQLISMLLEWIGHYILEYLQGPLTDVKEGMTSFNDWLIQNIPKIAEAIGTTIGVFLKFLIILGKVLAFLWKLGSPIVAIVNWIKKINQSIDKLSDGTKKAGRIILAALIFAFSPLLLVVALIEDLITFLQGGQSVTGDVLDWIKNKWDEIIDKLTDKFGIFKKLLNIKDDAKEWWKSYYDSASQYFDELWKKAKTVLSDIKEWSKGTFEKGKDWIGDKVDKGREWLLGSDIDDDDFVNVGKKVLEFDRNYGDDSSGTVANSYMTNTSNSTKTTNNNNDVSNKNTINVYSNDPNQTGNVIDKRLTGITSRNLQGAIE